MRVSIYKYTRVQRSLLLSVQVFHLLRKFKMLRKQLGDFGILDALLGQTSLQ
jgi:hypothetical protein